MWTAVIILLWSLAAVFSLLLAVLASPLRLEFRARAGELFHYRLAMQLFGRFGPVLTVADSNKPSRRKERKARKKKAKPGKATRRDPTRMIRAVFRLIAEIAGQLHVESLALDVKFGAEDPAETGQLYGKLTPLIYGLIGSRRVKLTVEPVFDRVVFDGLAALVITFTPARLLPPFVRFGWSAFGPGR